MHAGPYTDEELNDLVGAGEYSAAIDAFRSNAEVQPSPRAILAVARAFLAVDMPQEALELLRSVTAGHQDQAIKAEALRQQLAVHTAKADSEAVHRTLRQLKRVDGLKTGELRRLFRSLQKRGQSAVVERYLAQWTRAEAAGRITPEMCADVLWSADSAQRLIAWLEERQPSLAYDPGYMRKLALRSERHNAAAMARVFWRRRDAINTARQQADRKADAERDVAAERPKQDQKAEAGRQRQEQAAGARDELKAAARQQAEARRASAVLASRASTQNWIAEAKAAWSRGDTPALMQMCERALADANFHVHKLQSVAAVLLGCDLVEEGLRVWDQALRPEAPMRLRLAATRELYQFDRHERVKDHFAALLDAVPAPDLLPLADQHFVAEIVRVVVRAAWKSGDAGRLADLKRGAATPFQAWIDAMIDLARMDHGAATAGLKAGQRLGPAPAGLDWEGELALVDARFMNFDSARRVLGRIAAGAEDLGYYDRRLSALRPVVDLCGPDRELVFPECVIDIILEETASDPPAYEPDPGHVMTVCGTLGHGGSERQAVTLMDHLSRHGAVRAQSLLVKSLDGEGEDFFLPHVRTLPVDVREFGRRWDEDLDIDAAFPTIAGRPRLRRAVELLPGSLRESMLRIAADILRTRPQVVHIRQDMFAAALACALAGVPRYLAHRGSLSRDHWDVSPLQDVTLHRPLRHVYRRLLEQTDFLVVNNSEAGRTSDIAWIGHEHAARHHVVHNGVDFGRLGLDLDPNLELRTQLGIAEDAFVVGGVFRFEPVKRPMLWIDAARHVLSRAPDTHFLILGDGEHWQDVVAFAGAHGFADRLHLPGSVTDVGAWYRAMDLVLLTSDREGLPNVLIEAQHFGVPAVSTDVGGAGETMLEGVTGKLAPPHDGPAAIAEVIAGIIADPEWRERARRAAPEFVHERFGTARVVDRVMELYGLG